jgi:hypothetical protein
MDASASTNPAASLRWRIPEGRGRFSLRFYLVQIALVTVFVGMLVIFLTPAEAQTGLLAASIAIALVLVAAQLIAHRQDASGPVNVWLYDTGLHWRGFRGSEHVLPRSLIQSFYVGHDEETRRDRLSLTLLLEGGFVSQPVELFPPGDAAAVRSWLEQRWLLHETRTLPADAEVQLAVTSEFDLQRQIWRIEGFKTGLTELVETFRNAAEIAVPPVGARPMQIVLEMQGQTMALAVTSSTWIEEDFFAATPETLRSLSEEIQSKLGAGAEPFELPLVADTGHHWRIAVKLRPPGTIDQ